MTFIYDAMGNKLRKISSNGTTTDYAGGIEYKNQAIESVYHSEGRVVPDIENSPGQIEYRHEYSIKDHLGNSRIMFSDLDNDGALVIGGENSEILQEEHYYPFGMHMEGNWVPQVGVKNAYLYNGKELNSDFGLDWLDYGARWYDPSIGRFAQVDPGAEVYSPISTYAYVANNPLIYIDPTGAYIEEGSQKEWSKQTGRVEKRRNKLQKKINRLKSRAAKKGWSSDKLSRKIGNRGERVSSLDQTIGVFTELENSSQGYSLSSNAGEVGGTSFDPNTGYINISFGSTSNFVHEVTHGGHYENGDIAFDGVSGASYGQDLGDEIDAYQAQYGYSPKSISGLTSTSKATSLSDINGAWVQGITTSTGDQPYAPGGSANTGQTNINVNSTKADFIRAYPGKMNGLPSNFNLKSSVPNIKMTPFLPGWYSQ